MIDLIKVAVTDKELIKFAAKCKDADCETEAGFNEIVVEFKKILVYMCKKKKIVDLIGLVGHPSKLANTEERSVASMICLMNGSNKDFLDFIYGADRIVSASRIEGAIIVSKGWRGVNDAITSCAIDCTDDRHGTGLRIPVLSLAVEHEFWGSSVHLIDYTDGKTVGAWNVISPNPSRLLIADRSGLKSANN